MKENENFNVNFDDKYEEIIASLQKKCDEYDDIVSDSRLRGGDISSTSSHYKKKNHGKSKSFKDWWQRLTKGKKAALISVTSIVLVIAILLGWFFSYFKYNYNSITENPEDLGFSGTIDKSVINIALFGVDARDEKKFTGNTDSIMIMSLNTKTKKVKIISVMRDTLVPMEYEGKKYYGKINSAYVKGPEHAIKTLNQAFDLDISEYATVNFYGMTDIINAVGGITATITDDELKWKGYDHPNLNNCMDEICNQMGLNAADYYIKSAGEQTLNGVQAVAYARVRNCTSAWGTRDDFGRTDRQRHVMQELFNKAVAMKKTQYAKLAKALIPCTETSLSYTDIMGLAFNILLSSPTFEQYRLPPAEYQSQFLMKGPSGYGSIIYYDLDYAAKLLHAVIYDGVTMEQYIEENGIETNDWYAKRNAGTSSVNRPSSNSSQGTTTSSNTPAESKPQTSSSDTTVTKPESTVDSPQDNASSEDVTSSEPSSSGDQTSSADTDSSDTPSTDDGTGGDKPENPDKDTQKPDGDKDKQNG